jgi:hypothetical protein
MLRRCSLLVCLALVGCASVHEEPVFRLDQPQPNGQHAVIEGYRDRASGGTRLVLTCSGGSPAANAELCQILRAEILHPTVPLAPGRD